MMTTPSTRSAWFILGSSDRQPTFSTAMDQNIKNVADTDPRSGPSDCAAYHRRRDGLPAQSRCPALDLRQAQAPRFDDGRQRDRIPLMRNTGDF